MNKPPRFMVEYYNHRMRELEANGLMEMTEKSKAKGHLTGVLRSYKHGFITIDETMRLLTTNDFE